MNFIQSSLKYKQVTISILAIVFAAGIYSLFTMPRREDPKITSPSGLIVAYYPGANSQQVENQVTKKIEQYLFHFEEVKKSKTYSTSLDGAVVIHVWLNDNVRKPDIFWNKLNHELMLAKSLELPKGVVGPLIDSDFSDTEALLIALESNQSSYQQLETYAHQLEDRLQAIPATSKVRLIGEQQEEIAIYFDSGKLAQYHLSLSKISQIIQSQNNITSAGELKTENAEVKIHTLGFYTNIQQIKNQIVGTSPRGDVIHLKDIATIRRQAAEQTSNITVNGKKAVIVAIQMNEGNNIVRFGDQVQEAIQQVSRELPSEVHLSTIVNQPQLVSHNVDHFLTEFLIAIISVIIVIVLLLPFQVAAVAAMAIPMTITATFAILHLLGIELHQVSLAALIVVLGMVVDDAIVVADNFVELLDQGIERNKAAWQCASKLVVPILTATITIIAAFMPMIILKGAVGDFIHDLPITVTVALTSSFIVAMLLTPMLCLAFIHKGLHNTPDKKQSRKSFLDFMQRSYNHTLDIAIKHPVLTIISSILSILLAAFIFNLFVGQQFFPYAERNQFTIELWMPTGTKLEQTEKGIRQIEQFVRRDKRITSYATFSGTSAPRIYYNYSPEFPVPNYAQLLINTTDDKATEELASSLTDTLQHLVPGGTVQVKRMQQGQPMDAPVEIRIFGDDIRTLQQLGASVSQIIKKARGSFLVHNNYREDRYGLTIRLKKEATRLGFSTGSIARLLYINTQGAVVSTLYEGDHRVNILLRQTASKRGSLESLKNTYLQSPVTGKSVPLREIATLTPEWHPGRIVHRNGMRCLTVQSETRDGVLPAKLLREIKPPINQLDLPAGYFIKYGGEYANKEETMSPMIVALGISLLLIFLILIFQFRTFKEAIVIMLTIPLSLLGAIVGLAITGNPFGFTAFMGLISLSGIVVRNAIIMIDYANELMKEGKGLKTAIQEAAKRRLRPIFLTAMAAAIGVVPMIASGSSLWSPLASVIAFGVIWSMLTALITIPVIYQMVMKSEDKATMRINQQA